MADATGEDRTNEPRTRRRDGAGARADESAAPSEHFEVGRGDVVASTVVEDVVPEEILAQIDPEHTGWTAEISVIRQIPSPADDPELRGAPPVADEPLAGPDTPPAPQTEVLWAPAPLVRKGIGGSALSFSISALVGSCVVGWLFPLGIFALILGIVAVRRPAESSTLGRWAIGLSALSLLYSAGWIWWVGRQLGWWF